MNRLGPVLLLGGCTCGASVTPQTPPPGPRVSEGSNVLFIVLDDVGVDQLAAYGATETASTPSIDRLAAEGVRFTHAWADALCSPSRMGMLTGQHAVRWGFGSAIAMTSTGLPFEAVTLPEVLGGAAHGRATAAIGKWHITGSGLGLDSPREHGFDHFSGTLGTLEHPADVTYFHWYRVDDGERSLSTAYATTDSVNTALRYAKSLPEPWTLWLAPHAPHEPFHVPPRDLTTHHASSDAPDRDKYRLMIEALDHELGRLLTSLPKDQIDRLTVVLIGDNGTPAVVQDHDTRSGPAKGSVHEAGIRVPLVIWGQGVQGGRVLTFPVSHVDMMPTLAALSGVALPADVAAHLDGIDLSPWLRAPDAAPPVRTVLSDHFDPNSTVGPAEVWERAVTDGRFKLIAEAGRAPQLYRLPEGLDEGPDLVAAGERTAEAVDALARLQAAAAAVPAPALAKRR